MRTDFVIFSKSIEIDLTYRFNYIMARVSSIFRFLTLYYFWVAMLGSQPTLLGFNSAELETYFFIGQGVFALVFATWAYNISAEIASGEMANFLLKPFSYFRYWFIRDMAGKLTNTSFNIVGLIFIYWLVKPHLIIPSSVYILAGFCLSLLLACILFFLIAFLLSSLTFRFST